MGGGEYSWRGQGEDVEGLEGWSSEYKRFRGLGVNVVERVVSGWMDVESLEGMVVDGEERGRWVAELEEGRVDVEELEGWCWL